MAARLTIADLPPKMRAEVERQLGGGKPLGLAKGRAVAAVQVEIAPDPSEKPKKRLRQSTARKLNKLEAEFGAWLRARRVGAAIHEQSVRLELANGCTYTPDFLLADDVPFDTIGATVEAYEVKGHHAWDDAIVKLKVAARAYPWITFYLAHKPNFEWALEEVQP